MFNEVTKGMASKGDAPFMVTKGMVSKGDVPLMVTTGMPSKGDAPLMVTKGMASKGGIPFMVTRGMVSKGDVPLMATKSMVSKGDVPLIRRLARDSGVCAAANATASFMFCTIESKIPRPTACLSQKSRGLNSTLPLLIRTPLMTPLLFSR